MGQVTEFNFSEEELLTFLATIEEEDQEIVDAEYDSAETLEDVLEEPPKLYNKEKAYEYAQRRKAKEREINDMAFDQRFVNLADYITKEHAQLIIQGLCSEFDRLIEKYSNYIINRCNALLSAKIPRNLRAAYKAYPQAFIKVPGFIYVVSTLGERPLFFYVPLNIPYFFEQGTETRVIEQLGLPYSSKINSAIARIEEYKTKKLKAEASYALSIAKLPRGSYIELLKAHPRWFEVLIDKLSNNEYPAIPKP